MEDLDEILVPSRSLQSSGLEGHEGSGDLVSRRAV